MIKEGTMGALGHLMSQPATPGAALGGAGAVAHGVASHAHC